MTTNIDTGAGETAGRARGAGEAMAGASFRDPVGLDLQVAALQLEIARTLVNAPALPIELRAFDLTLLAVAAERSAIDLVLGKSSPLAKVRIERASTPTDAGDGPSARPAATAITIIDLHPDAKRFQPALLSIRRRLLAAISVGKLERALVRARQLAGIPVGVPLAFYRQLVP